MYKVPSTARNLGYREKGCPPVKISNKMPVTTGEAKLQMVASDKEMPAHIEHLSTRHQHSAAGWRTQSGLE